MSINNLLKHNPTKNQRNQRFSGRVIVKAPRYTVFVTMALITTLGALTYTGNGWQPVQARVLSSAIDQRNNFPLEGDVIELNGKFEGFIPGTDHVLLYNLIADTSHLYDTQGNKITDFPGRVILSNSPDNRLIVFSRDDEAYHLYDTAGNELTALAGVFPRFTLGGSMVATIPSSIENANRNNNNHSILYDGIGNELFTLPGRIHSFSSNGHRWLTQNGDRIQLYNELGNPLAALEGNSAVFNEQGTRIIAYEQTSQALTSRNYQLYDSEGQAITHLPDGIADVLFLPNSDRFIVSLSTEPISSSLYDRNGKEIATLPGYLRDLNHDGSRIITYEDRTQRSHIFDSEGNHLATLNGWFAQASPDGKRLATTNSTDLSVHIYSGTTYEQLGTLVGDFGGFNHSGDQIITYRVAEDTSYLYDSENHPIATLPGQLSRFSQNDAYLVTQKYTESVFHLFDRSGNELATLSGVFEGFNDSDTHIITNTLLEDGRYTTQLWDLANITSNVEALEP